MSNEISTRNKTQYCFVPAVTLLALFFLAGCTPKSKGIAELKRLCAKDAGFEIYRTVEAKGLHHQTGYMSLVESPYDFMEFCDETGFLSYDTPKPGCYRMEKIKRSEGECHQELDARISRFIVDPYPEFLAEHCIAVKSIEAPTARYSFRNASEQWFSNNDQVKFTRSQSWITDNEDNSVMARYVTYFYDQGPSFTSSITCHNAESSYPSYAETNMIERVIQPKS